MNNDGSHFNVPSSAPHPSYIMDKLGNLPEDILAKVRRWSVSDIGAAIARELNEPLTALRLYLHEIKEENEHSSEPETAFVYTQDVVEKALAEIERICSIVEQISDGFKSTTDREPAVANGREVIDRRTDNNTPKGGGPGFPGPVFFRQHLLTPMEQEVLGEISLGASNKVGGYRLGISPKTFEANRTQLKRKLGARNTVDLVRMALGETK
jgi:DNA-binding CsgD family transcriptional regulator